jgi:hypothetical protein
MILSLFYFITSRLIKTTMKTTVTLQNNYPGITAVFNTRVTTALNMLELMSALNTEQETEGEYDGFLSKLRDTMEPYKVNYDVIYEFFKGHSDVIFEFRLYIYKVESEHKTNSEQIAGTMFNAIAEHFKWKNNWSNSLILSGDDYSTRDFKSLTIFH